MGYGLAAEAVLTLHAAFIAFVLGGGLLVLRWRWIAWLHLPAVAWGALIEIGGWMCPLTPLEQRLRLAAGEAGYTGGFIEHYLAPLIYPPGLTRPAQFAMAAVVLAVNVGVYAVVVRRGMR